MTTLACQGLDVDIAGLRVVTGLEFTVRPGEFWGLLGPNGIGKTTLLKCLAGLRSPSSGAVTLGSRALEELPRRQLARQLGMLQQHTVYVFDSSVMQTVLTGRHPHLGYWEREGPQDIELAEQALRAVDLSGLGERSVTELSGGEARRLAFATLLVQEVNLLLLDEPTNHLDLRHQVHIMGMIRDGCRERASGAVAALHDINLAARFCSHVLMLFGEGQWCAGPVDGMLGKESLERLYGCPVERLESADGPRFYPLEPRS